jgi:hypothetical protein
LLEVVAINKNASILTMWVEDPKFSNSSGSITLNGGVPNPGFVGSSGEIVSVVFRAKKTGTASLVFGDSAVRQNDGLGTDILTMKQVGSIAIGGAIQEAPVSVGSRNVPLKPVVFSSTHPQQTAWYSGTTASFNWTAPSDVSSIQTLLGKNPTTIPTVTYDGSVSQKTINNLTDGVMYFHIRYMNSIGWSPTTHYKIQVDTTPPEKFTSNIRIQDGRNVLALNAFDALSGIDSYLVKIDDAAGIRLKKDEITGAEYMLPVQLAGDHDVTVTAYDKAGNSTQSHGLFVSPVITAPVISVASTDVERNSVVTVQGTSIYPDTRADIFVQLADGQVQAYTTKTGTDGAFSVVTDELKVAGLTQLTAKLVFSDAVQSPRADGVTVRVHDTVVVRAGKSLMYMLSFIIPALILLLGLIFTMYLGWHKYFGLRRKLQVDLNKTTADIHKALMVFRGELSNQLLKLEKIREDRELNRKEEKIFKDLEGNIDDIDAFVEKKLKNIK